MWTRAFAPSLPAGQNDFLPHPDKKTPPLIQQTKNHFKIKQGKSVFWSIFVHFKANPASCFVPTWGG
jgi:hypothetical protein